MAPLILKSQKLLPLLLLLLWACSSTPKAEETPSSPEAEEEPGIAEESGLQLDKLVMPEGFKISVFARVNNARSLAIGDEGTIFVGNRGGDKVYAIRDTNGDQVADERYVIASGMRMPNGVAFKDGTLYIAEVSKLWKIENVESTLNNPNPVLIRDDYPTDGHHGWKYIAFGPDGKLYVPVGAPCNICESKDPIYASITRLNADGTDREVFVSGVRNTVGFTWHPVTGEMWFTDNGRDMISDDMPNCELNRVTKAGEHFGYPYCHQGDFKDPEFGDKRDCSEFTAPAQKMGPHVAPLGLKFYTGSMFPEAYKNLIFVAEHGSWNRSSEAGHTGHLVSTVKEANGIGVEKKVFIEGFLNKETNTAWGRPVDILILKDGSMLISDDLSGTIYRVTYSG